MTNFDSILKSRDITLPTKVCLVKAMVFPVTIYGCECWTIKKAECWRIEAFELWWWRRLLRVPWTARRSNQSILKEISPGSSLDGLMLKLKLWYFGHLMQRADSFEKDPVAGKDWGQEEKGTTEDEMVGWHHRLNGCGFGWTLGVADGQGDLACCGSWGRIELDHWVTELNCTEYTANGNHASLGFTAHRFWVRFFVSWWILCHTMPLFWAFADPSRKTVHQMSKGLCLFNYLTKDYIVIKSRNRI